jgi:CHAT domain-containing protein
VIKVDIGKAFDSYKRASEVAVLAQAFPGDRATILYKISEVQRLLGDVKQAAENEDAAFALLKNGTNKRLEAQIIADRAFRMAEEVGADETVTVQQANEMAVKFVNQIQAAIDLINDQPGGKEIALRWLDSLGLFMARARQFQPGIDILKKVLATARTHGYKFQEAITLSDLGSAEYLSGDYRTSVNDLNQSLSMFRSVGLRGREGKALEFLMLAWSKLNNRSLAIFFGKSAVNRFQEIRKTASAFSSEQQKAALSNYENAYRFLAKLLVEDGRIAEAEQVLTMLKQEELLEYVRRDDTVAKQLLNTITLSAEEQAAISRYGALAEQITALGKEFGDLESERRQYGVGEFPKQKRYDELRQQLADASTTFEKFLEELKLKFGQTDTRVAQVDSSLKKTLERLKANKTAVISTIVGEDTLNIIVTTSKTQRAHTIKVPAKEINDLVAKFHSALTSPQYDPRPIAQKLYDLLVKPVEGDLAGIKADTILWSLDGTLRYIPPAALWDKKNGYLAERFANVMINLASRDTLALPTGGGRKLSVLGVGVSKGIEGFSPLAAVPDELDCIVSDTTAGVLSAKPQCTNGVLNGRKLLDDKFTLTNFEGELGRYPIVHIASHFKLTPGDDKNSFLLLGGGPDRKFTVEKLRSEPLTDIELIVLSACNTATPGGSRTNGVEVEGFGSIAQKEGAKSVMATLWSVADTSTKDFMVEFYRLYGKEGKSKAEAMRLAQMKLMNGRYSAEEAGKHRSEPLVETANSDLPKFTVDPKAPFAHPFYWSPFTLIGNWR